MIISIEHKGKIVIKNNDGDVPLGIVSFNIISKVAEIDSELKFTKDGDIGIAKHNVITVLRDFDAYFVLTGEKIKNLEHYQELNKLHPPIIIDKPIAPLLKLVREGTQGTCPKCGSTEIREHSFLGIPFGKIKGCIQPDCEKYYKRKADFKYTSTGSKNLHNSQSLSD